MPRNNHPPRFTADEGVPGAFAGETVTRRRLMTAGAHGMGAIAAASFTLPALGFALGPVFKHVRATWQDVGTPADFTPTTFTRATIVLVPGIGEAGHSTAYIRRRDPAVDTEAADQYDQYIAISSRCVHVGCPVNYVSAAQRFVCPCHGGVYDLRGQRLGGPPPRPLDRFYTRVRDGLVQVGPRYSVNSALKRFSLRDPGEALDGIGQFLYPSRPTTPGL